MAVEVGAVVKQISESTSQGSARTHQVLCDRPEAKGGSDAGAMGGELFLLGLGGCFLSNLLAAIKARNSDIAEVEVRLTAQLDGTPPRFTEVSMAISGSYGDKDEMEKLALVAERGCIVANTIKDAVQLHIRVE
jgi:putative redox protein